jgi:hypothetical protein
MNASEVTRPEVDQTAESIGEPWANWMWLMAGSARGDLLVIGALAAVGVVAERFARARQMDSTDGMRTLAPESVDVVVWQNGFRSALDRSPPLGDCLRTLRPGGMLYVDGTNPGWFREPRAWMPRNLYSHATVTKAVRRAGFREVRQYFLDSLPLTLPRVIVPAGRHAIMAWERFSSGWGLRPLGRLAIASAGPVGLLYPGVCVVAQK